MRFLRFEKKIIAQDFSDFLHEVTVTERLIIDLKDFLEKNFVMKLLDQKGPKIQPEVF